MTVPSEDLRSSQADWSVHTLGSDTTSSNSKSTLGYCRSYGKQDNWMFWEPWKLMQATALDKTDRWNEERVLALTLNILAFTICIEDILLCSLGNARGISTDIMGHFPWLQRMKICHFINTLSSSIGGVHFPSVNIGSYHEHKQAKNSVFDSSHYFQFVCARSSNAI